VKSSQIGLDIGDDVFQENLARIVDAANAPGGGSRRNRHVRLDRHGGPRDHRRDARRVRERHAIETDGNVGVCVQANLKRTREDLERLADPREGPAREGSVRRARRDIVQKEARVDESYRDCLAYMFETFDDGVAVGSHDPAMIEYASELHAEHGTPYEVQMLMGVREAAQFDLAADPDVDAEVYQYIPYGSKWFSYFYRRIRERKSNALFALRAIVGR